MQGTAADEAAVTRQPAASVTSRRQGRCRRQQSWCRGQQACGQGRVGRLGQGQAGADLGGFRGARLRNLIASLIWLVAVLAAAVLALGALFTALDQTNQSNEIVRWVLERGHDLVGPFKDLFRLETAKNTLLVNWGIAALVYLIAGKIIERFVRP